MKENEWSRNDEIGSSSLLPRPIAGGRDETRFRKPISDADIASAQESSVPKATEKQTEWSIKLWKSWSSNRKSLGAEFPDRPPHLLSLEALNQWLCKFILEVRRKDGKEYPPITLYQIACGILRHVRKYAPSVNFFANPEFAQFKLVLDGEMKKLRAKGLGTSVKRAEPIRREEEDALWENGVLGKGSPQALLDTMVYMCGMFFALRSGKEHRDLQFNQLKLTKKDGIKCLRYTENVSKNNPGGLKQRKLEPKIVEHYENLENPDRCFIKLYECYLMHCPIESERKKLSFYLTPLKKPKTNVWYSSVPVGHNTLAKTVGRICAAAGIEGFKTNHSLRVTTATRLFQAGVEEQLIMKRTGHRSVDGIRLYKRISSDQDQTISAILNSNTASSAIQTTSSTTCKRQKVQLNPLDPEENNASKTPYTFNFSNCTNVNLQFN